MSISSDYGCELKDLSWKKWANGTVSKEIVIATRIEDGKLKEYHISNLRADGGIQEIIEALR